MSRDLRKRDVGRHEEEVTSGGGDQSLYKTFSIRNWMIFLNERAPPFVFLMIAAGPSLTAMYYIQNFIEWDRFLWGLFAELVLLLTVRVMDDVKDYELDKDIHPNRPLPRGLLRYEDVCSTIKVVLGALLFLAGVMALRFDIAVGALFAAQVIYAELMYVEFFLGDWFEQWVFLYALSHQLNIYFASFFIVALSGGEWNGYTGLWLGSLGLSGFFTYEVCRKLDPSLPRRKGTYLVVYGKSLTFLIVCFTVSVGVIASYALSFSWFLWPLQGLMLVSLLILFLLPPEHHKPKRHKIVELLSVAYMLIHFWSGTIDHLCK